MQISALFIGLVLLGGSLFYVSLPFRQRRRIDINPSKAPLKQEGRREIVLGALRDLDFDFKTGKVIEEDYNPLRAQLMLEAARYIEAEMEVNDQLEALIQARRTAQQHDLKCQQCEAPIQTGQRFCAKCGSAINKELCPSCGKKIRAGDRFCSSCGNRLEIPVKAVA
ncbi:MAG TPA: zinc ribbon domain-containing protein [Anaerolineales bacterium]